MVRHLKSFRHSLKMLPFFKGLRGKSPLDLREGSILDGLTPSQFGSLLISRGYCSSFGAKKACQYAGRQAMTMQKHGYCSVSYGALFCTMTKSAVYCYKLGLSIRNLYFHLRWKISDSLFRSIFRVSPKLAGKIYR